MEENVIVTAQFKKNYAQYIFLGVGALLFLIWFFVHVYSYNNFGDYEPIYTTYIYIEYKNLYDSFGEYLINNITSSVFTHATFALFIFSILSFALAILSHFYFRCEMVVTDKRVYGKSAFGKRVDLPLSKINSLSSSILWSLGVATSSGKILFSLIKNRDEVYERLTELIIKKES